MFKYGDVLERKYYFRGHKKECFRYRIDPVPGTGGYGSFRLFRRIKTTQERKIVCEHKHLVRIRGNRKNLPDNWDDICRSNSCSKSWKNRKVKKQYLKNTKKLQQDNTNE